MNRSAACLTLNAYSSYGTGITTYSQRLLCTVLWEQAPVAKRKPGSSALGLNLNLNTDNTPSRVLVLDVLGPPAPVLYVVMVWLGWAYFSIKVPSPWHQGVCFNLPMIFCA
jgi:hypothetical protein